MALKTVLSRGNLQWHSKTWPLFCKSGWFLNELADRCPKRIEHYTLNKYPGVIVGALRNVNEKYKAISRTFLGQLLLSNWKSWCMFLASSDGIYRRFQIKDSHSVFFFFFLIACIFPHPCLLTLVCIFYCGLQCCLSSPVSVKQIMFFQLRSLCQYLFSVSQMFFSTLTQRLVFTFPLGGKFPNLIWKRHAKHVFNYRKV